MGMFLNCINFVKILTISRYQLLNQWNGSLKATPWVQFILLSKIVPSLNENFSKIDIVSEIFELEFVLIHPKISALALLIPMGPNLISLINLSPKGKFVGISGGANRFF